MLCKIDKSLTLLWRTRRHINLVDAKPPVICKAVEKHSGLICPGRPASILADQVPFGTIVCFENIQIQIQYLKLSFPASSFGGSHCNPLACTTLTIISALTLTNLKYGNTHTKPTRDYTKPYCRDPCAYNQTRDFLAMNCPRIKWHGLLS